jgi:YhcH/YjgK/YiaL family protein
MALFGSLATVRAQAPHLPHLDAAFAYAAEVTAPGSDAHRRLLALPEGESFRVELGGGLHAIEQVYRTRAPGEYRLESHFAHLDLQLVVLGEELLEVAEVGRLRLSEDGRPAKDVAFYSAGPAPTALRLGPGDAALLFPADGHMGGLRAGEPGLVRKAVVKVPVR